MGNNIFHTDFGTEKKKETGRAVTSEDARPMAKPQDAGKEKKIGRVSDELKAGAEKWKTEPEAGSDHVKTAGGSDAGAKRQKAESETSTSQTKTAGRPEEEAERIVKENSSMDSAQESSAQMEPDGKSKNINDLEKNDETISVFEEVITETGIAESIKQEKKQKQARQRKSKYLSIFISVIMAIGLWVFVTNTENRMITDTYSDIPIDYLNEDILEEKGLVVAKSDTTATAKVVLQGTRTELNALDASDITVTVDVSKYERGDSYADVEVHVPSSVTVDSVKPSQIKIAIESRVSVDQGVSVVFSGTSPANQEAVCLETDPESVSVTGASSAVKSVKNVRAVVDISKVSQTADTLEAELQPVDEMGNVVSGLTLSAERAKVKVQLYSTKTVPLVVKTEGRPDIKYSVSIEAPESVLISCPGEILDSVTKVETETVDLSEITESKEVSLIPILENDVRLASYQERISALVKVKKRETKRISIDSKDVVISGLAEGREVEFSEEQISFDVYCDNDISGLNASDFTLMLDASQLTVGEKEITLNVRLSDKAHSLSVDLNPVSVNAKLVKQAE